MDMLNATLSCQAGCSYTKFPPRDPIILQHGTELLTWQDVSPVTVVCSLPGFPPAFAAVASTVQPLLPLC